MNRLEDLFRDPDEPERQDDYFVIETFTDSFVVSVETAVEVERWLDHRPPPRWLVIRSFSGARHRILAEQIYRISECTAAQRAAAREFARARKLENKRDRRPWEEDD
jgi:hypothetical protein